MKPWAIHISEVCKQLDVTHEVDCGAHEPIWEYGCKAMDYHLISELCHDIEGEGIAWIVHIYNTMLSQMENMEAFYDT